MSTEVFFGVSLGLRNGAVALATRSEGTKAPDGAEIVPGPARPDVVANETGARTTPMCTAFVNGESLIGSGAKAAALRYPKQSVSLVLPLQRKSTTVACIESGVGKNKISCFGASPVGCCDDEERAADPRSTKVQLDIPSWVEAIHGTINDDGDVDTTKLPTGVECLEALLENFVAQVRSAAGGNKISSLVFTVPRLALSPTEEGEFRELCDPQAVRTAIIAYMKEKGGEGLTGAFVGSKKTSGSAAASASSSGSASLTCLCDDTAAALWALPASALSNTAATRQSCRVVCIHFGAYRVTCSVFLQAGGALTLLASESDFSIGGNAIDEQVALMLCQTCKRKLKQDPSQERGQRPWRKLLSAAEDAKIVLSASNSTGVEIEALADGMDFVDQLNRAKLESVIDQLGATTKVNALLQRTLQKGGAATAPVGYAVFTGGSAKIPKVYNMLCDQAKQMNPSIVIANEAAGGNSRVSPDEIPALGAAIAAQQPNLSYVTRAQQHAHKDGLPQAAFAHSVPVLSFNLVVGTGSDKSAVPIIPARSPLPCSVDVPLSGGSSSSEIVVGAQRPADVEDGCCSPSALSPTSPNGPGTFSPDTVSWMGKVSVPAGTSALRFTVDDEGSVTVTSVKVGAPAAEVPDDAILRRLGPKKDVLATF